MPDQHPEGLPEQEPETYPQYVPINPDDLPEGMFDTIMRGVASEVNHQQLHRYGAAIAHAEDEAARERQAKSMFRWVDTLSSSELRDTLRYAVGVLAGVHQEVHNRSKHRVWNFIKSIVLDPGSWILSAVVVGYIVTIWFLA